MNNSQLLEGYKLTEVGVIPKDWDVFTIGQTVTLINGRAFKPSDWKTSGLPIIRIQNLNDPMAAYNYYEDIVEDRYYVNNGDILFAWSGTKESSFGARMWRGQKAILNQHIFRVVPNEKNILSQYLLLALKRFQEDIEKKSHGFKASFVHIKKSDLENTHLAVPPLPEQRSIATALSDMDELLGGLDRLIAKKRDLKQAAMQELLTGKTRLQGFDGEWEETTLGEIGECVIGLTYKPENVVKYGLLVLRSSNVQNGQLAYADNVYVNLRVADHLVTRIGDILICVRNGSRALIGKCAVINANAAGLTFGAFMSIYRTNYWRFIAHTFQSDDIQKQIRDNIGATINQITNKDMKAFRVLLPPENEQIAIASILSDMDTEIAAIEQRRNKTRDLKQAMMQELLTGRIRLV